MKALLAILPRPFEPAVGLGIPSQSWVRIEFFGWKRWQWQDTCSEAEGRCTELEQQLETLKEEKSALANTVDSLKQEGELVSDAKSSLDAQIASLEDAIDGELENATGEDDNIAEAKSSLDAQIASLEDAIDEELEDVKKMDEQVSPEGDAQNLESLHAKLGEAEETLERVAELESEVKSLGTQLEEQESEAKEVISQWQDTCAAAEEKCAELQRKLDAM